jgi:hypothetical protein
MVLSAFPACAGQSESALGLKSAALKAVVPAAMLAAQKKVSGTFRRSHLHHLVGLESSRHLFLGLLGKLLEVRVRAFVSGLGGSNRELG